MQISREVTDMFRTERGGWTRKQLAEWGVNWPPLNGWRKRLALGLDPNIPDHKPIKRKKQAKVPFNQDAEQARVEMKKLYQEKSGDYSY